MSTPTVVPATLSAAPGTENLLAAHITLTPLGVPGPTATVPGAFPPALAEETTYGDIAKEQTLFESAKAHLPAQRDVVRSLRAYLPLGVAAYLPDSESLSSVLLHPPSNTALHEDTVDVARATSVLYSKSAPGPYASADVPIPTGDESTTVHTGYSTDAIPPSASDVYLALVQSPSALSPNASTDLALAAQRVQSHPTWTLSLDSGYVGSSESELAQTPGSMDSSDHSPISSSPNDIFPSSSSLALASDVPGSAALDSINPKELIPHADSPRAADASMSSTPPKNLLLSVETPTPAETEPKGSPSDAPSDAARAWWAGSSEAPGPSEAEELDATNRADVSPFATHARPQFYIHASAATLNLSAPKDVIPADLPPKCTSERGHGDASSLPISNNPNDVFPRSGAPSLHLLGLAALNSSDPKDPIPGGSSEQEEEVEVQTLAVIGYVEGAQEGYTKKPKLMQRLKNKMHVGGEKN
ncbi:hypothetical protein C8F04DRAFT_1230597 [Mycena alexandri]|uniref:Uncharacterized protein n=1 Tax=Mycena alexandri TaxID=1745969 RepID=A0AAD6XAH5_9AGAR|nr:hypothetical protein C8F04DRAFT_1230597 [Mycena alexandri]